MSYIVSVTLTDREYSEVKKAAEEKGLTISQYVKRYPISDDEFNLQYEFLKNESLKTEKDVPFSVMSVFGDKWDTIPRGIRLSLGRNFYHLVKRGELKGIITAGKSIYNIQMYVRKWNNYKVFIKPF